MANDQLPEPFPQWLVKKYFDEISLAWRTAWDLYLKFYTIFLTFNGTALGLTMKYIHDCRPRIVICIFFMAQNVISAVTAVKVAQFSKEYERRFQDVAKLAARLSNSKLPSELSRPPVPGDLGSWGGTGNTISHIIFVVLWFAVIFIP